MSTREASPPIAVQLTKRVRAERRWSAVTFRVGIGIFALALFGALFASMLAPYSPNSLDLLHRLEPPSTHHLMGTDQFGRDIFSRVLYALRLDLFVTFVITYAPLAIGMVLGAIAGYWGGWVDNVLMRTVDAVIAFPFLVLVIAIVAITGTGLTGVFIGVPLVGWALYARLTRGEMLVVREQDFMLAATTLGYSRLRILCRHALPSLWRANLVYSASDLVLNLLLLASLSYLGLGVQPPTAELGVMVADGQSVLLQAWWVATLPGLCIVLLGVSFSMIGDGLSDRLRRQF